MSNKVFQQNLNEIGASGLGAFFVIQVLLEHFIAHTYSSLFLMASSICLLTVSI